MPHNPMIPSHPPNARLHHCRNRLRAPIRGRLDCANHLLLKRNTHMDVIDLIRTILHQPTEDDIRAIAFEEETNK